MTTEKTAAAALVRNALAAGYLVSVFDGEEWTVKRSTDEKTITDALEATCEDRLSFWRADGSRVGSALLVWGNAEDGSELVADHTDNEAMRALVGF